MSARPKRKAQSSPLGTRFQKHSRGFPITGDAFSPSSSTTPGTAAPSSNVPVSRPAAGAKIQMAVRANGGSEEVAGEAEVMEWSGPESESESEDGSFMEGPEEDSQKWQETTELVVPTVVSIRFCLPESFDSEFSDTSEATGFVVDAERGYILTNRHVVGAGPFWGYCVFDNHEEVDVYAVYRDPIHDFGILRFDPKAIKYMPLRSLQLRPDLAKVGLDIRVVGNDAGEKLCILSGIISRVDRNAPEYADGYSDFNTCYYQTNAAASGGSSGSPVVNIDGHAVALQAGGRIDGASTDYMLPLDRALRALKLIQASKPVERGDIQTQFLLKPFDECRRLGLSANREKQMRAAFPIVNHLLVVEIVLPEGPAHGKLEEGDILLEINGELISDFIQLDEIMDSSVGKSIKITIQRVGTEITLEIPVGDLHAISPDRFLTVSGGSFHNLSYHQARLYGVPCRGVYVCEASSSFRLKTTETGLVLDTIDHKPVPNIDIFADVISKIPDRARVVVTYRNLRDIHTLQTTIVTIDRHWARKMRMATRNDVTGLWDFKNLADPLPPAPPQPRKAAFITLSHTKHPAVANLVRSMVQVTAVIPMKLDGFPRNRRWAMGVVIDAEKGLVIVSRAIVPYDLCDITITIADSVQLVGKVVFLHPLQNYAVIQYDPSLVSGPIESARLSDQPMYQGESTYFLGINRQNRLVHAATSVTEVTAVCIPCNAVAPRYRAVNVEAITIDSALGGQSSSGVLAASDGTIQALWLAYLGEQTQQGGHRHDEEYHLGLSTVSLLPIIEKLRKGETPSLRMLPVEFVAIPMSQAHIMGIDESWIEKVSEANATQHQLFMVHKRWLETEESKSGLNEGDIILTLNGKIITRVNELDVMYDHKTLEALVVRKRKQVALTIKTSSADGVETTRALYFAGAILHKPHLAVRQQISKLPSEVYISARSRGSPAGQYGLAPTNFITHVNKKETKDLDSFLAAVKEIPNNTYFVIKAVSFDCVPWVVTMKKNVHYFPTIEWVKDAEDLCGWKRIIHDEEEDEVPMQTVADASMD